MKFCLCDLENKIILKGPMDLPHVFKDEVGETSVFQSLSLAELKARNWLPVEDENVNYNEATELLNGIELTVEENRVVRKPKIELISESEKPLNDWKISISQFDQHIPRSSEDILDFTLPLLEMIAIMRLEIIKLGGKVDETLTMPSNFMLNKYDDKKDVRATNPNQISKDQAITKVTIWDRIWNFFGWNII